MARCLVKHRDNLTSLIMMQTTLSKGMSIILKPLSESGDRRIINNKFPKMATSLYIISGDASHHSWALIARVFKFLVTFLLVRLSCSRLSHVSPADSGCDVTISRPICAGRQAQCFIVTNAGAYAHT